MYAIVQDRSRCLTLAPGDELWVDSLSAEPGAEIVFDQVQLVKADDGTVSVGTPIVEGAVVLAEVIEQLRGDKILVSTFKRRKSSKRRLGHRQPYTSIRVKEIQLNN